MNSLGGTHLCTEVFESTRSSERLPVSQAAENTLEGASAERIPVSILVAYAIPMVGFSTATATDR
jgi:hypothetical protein